MRKRRWFWTNLIGHGVSNLTAGIFMTLGSLIAIRELGGEISWVVIYQCGMAGMVIGAFLTARLSITRPLIATSLGGEVFALPLASFAIPAPVWVNASAYFVAMLGLSILNALWQTVMQQQFPPQTLTRADSYDALLSFAARPLGLALAAPVAALTGEAAVLIAAAVLVGAFNLALIVLPDVRGCRCAPLPNRNRRSTTPPRQRIRPTALRPTPRRRRPRRRTGKHRAGTPDVLSGPRPVPAVNAPAALVLFQVSP